MIGVLFVCRGNICRSPALQATFEDLVRKKKKEGKYQIDSAGIDSWFLGDDPDPRMQKAAGQQGVFMRHKARIFQSNDFYQFDYIFAVNHDIYSYLLSLVPTKEMQDKIYLVSEFSKTHKDEEIPDPYYGSTDSFESVFALIQDMASSILEHLEKK